MPAEAVQPARIARVVCFGSFEADLQSGELRKRGIRLGLRTQSFQVLAALLQRPGQLVTREYLQRVLWRDEVFVDFDNNLNAVVCHLREVLNDSAEHPRFIETLPKRGYRFIGETYVPPEPQPKPERLRLVVLPFLDMSEPAQEYLGNSITDEIITALASMSPQELAVIARTSSMHYKDTRKDVAHIARELNVSYVVEGGIRRENEHISVNVQLIECRSQSHVFARRYEVPWHDVLQLHTVMARDLAAHLGVAGIAAEAHRTSAWLSNRKPPTTKISAYNEYIEGRYLAERLIPEEMAKAKQHFANAIRFDPEFALAHMAMADLYSWMGYKGYMRPIDAYSAGIGYALRAVELNDTLAEAHAVLASYHKQLDYNWPAAERCMERAIALNPTSPFVKYCNAMVILMPHSRIDEAVAELRGALESDPLDTGIRCWLGIMLLLGRNYEAGIKEAKCMLELEPNSCWPPFIEGIAYRQMYFEESLRGNFKPEFAAASIAGHRRAVELAPGAEHLLAWYGFALGVCGKKEEARNILTQFKRSEHYILPTNFAHLYLGLGEIDTAFAWFDRAVEERDQNMMPILSYAHFDPLRSDPRFGELLCKMKLPGERQLQLRSLLS
jgi:TolB-like protein/tetratricopeptide (TPR) repeat protein